ncbi:TonB-dependent receptor [Novosphingobium flavum]|uniref:TonB-dependent receptor n=1 Tax=Novosphingobium aerophilum TaxID=2839843 RepID=A0A7X1F903_9SPHN|nr:TonB-dependent receptor [Novosphingobium aerophilum]MBC2652199.1 TonB-dependent receptor [Novosphingobium aerophilum]MBC2662688.1 TonB-dependent receptor [Novosphingobium aerophilum]
MKFQLLLSAAALAAVVPGVVQAAEAAPEEIVVLASGFAQRADRTGQAITVVSRDRIETLQAVTIGDALRALPSLSVAQRGPVGTQSSVFVRGGNSSQTLVLIDGVRVNDPSSPNAAFDFGGLLAGNTDRIEVLRGPNSIVWGSQAIGGVINIETAKPTGPLALRGSAEYGAYNTANARLNLSGSQGAVGYSLGGTVYRTDGFSVFAAPGAEADGGRQAALNGRVTVALAPGLSLDLRGNWSRVRSSYDSAFSGGANSLAEARNTQWYAYAGLNLEALGGRLRSRVAYTRADIDRRGTDPVVFSFNTYLATGLTERIEWRSVFDLTPRVQIAAGLEHEAIRASTSFEGARPDRASNRVNGGYLQLSLRPLEGLTLTGGLRHDVYSDYGAHTTLGGNLAYTPNGGRTVLRATYAEGFRAPSLSEGQPPYGNPLLKPETAQNVDIGIEQALLGDALSATVTWYHRRSTNLIVFSATTFRSQNIGRAEANGIEAALVLRPSRTLRVEASYALVDAFDRSFPNANQRLPLRPQHSASISLDWQSPVGLRLGTSLFLVGDSFDNAANTVRIDGWRRVDLRASLPLPHGLELFGRVENLTDERYQTVAGYNTPGRSAFVGARFRV